MKIKILKPLRKYLNGNIVNIECDKHCIPLDKYWRRRLEDAKIDQCIEIVADKSSEIINKSDDNKNPEQKKKSKVKY